MHFKSLFKKVMVPKNFGDSVLSDEEVISFRETTIVADALENVASFCNVSSYFFLHSIARYYKHYTERKSYFILGAY